VPEARRADCRGALGRSRVPPDAPASTAPQAAPPATGPPAVPPATAACATLPQVAPPTAPRESSSAGALSRPVPFPCRCRDAAWQIPPLAGETERLAGSRRPASVHCLPEAFADTRPPLRAVAAD